MARARKDPLTADLFDWTPPAIVDRYEPRAVQAVDWRGRMSRAVAETLSASEMSREEIAQAMGLWLGEEVPVSTLSAYASQAREEHTISLIRAFALIVVTGDGRLLQLMAEEIGQAVIADRYIGAVHEAMIEAQLEELAVSKRAARRRWKGAR